MSEGVRHTQGPWRLAGVNEPDRVVGPIAGGGTAIVHTVATVSHGLRTNAEAEANARLIAAAPDLLTAVSKLMKSLSISPSGCYLSAVTLNTSVDDYNAVVVAIAKARGEGVT